MYIVYTYDLENSLLYDNTTIGYCTTILVYNYTTFYDCRPTSLQAESTLRLSLMLMWSVLTHAEGASSVFFPNHRSFIFFHRCDLVVNTAHVLEVCQEG